VSCPDLARRSVPELRADRTRLVGYAVVFDTRSRDLGGFVEIVRPSAVERAIRADASVVALYTHDAGAVLGRTPKTLRLTRDEHGLAFELERPQTRTGQDVLELVTRGDVNGASFRFRTVKDAWRKDGDGMIHELLDVEIAEISLTAFPAYDATDVAVAQRMLGANQTMPIKRTTLNRSFRPPLNLTSEFSTFLNSRADATSRSATKKIVGV
jgi:HK97 family phage prohead protease